MDQSSFIPLSVPNICGREREYVLDALDAGWVSTGGARVTDFERCIAEYVGAPGAVSCQNGTAALHLSLLLCGVTNADIVLVPTLTFIAAVNPVSYIGAEPVFMDCDEELCLDPVKVERYCREECHMEDGQLTDNRTGKHVKAMLVVHVFGNMAQMEPLMGVAARYGLRVIEDATEALGTRYTAGRYAGRHAGMIGDVGALSFNGNKIVTTGGGGMFISSDMALLRRAKHLSTQAKADAVYFEHDEIGYNYRLTNMQAAMGLAQMELLPEFIRIKKENYRRYFDAIRHIDGLHMLGFRAGTDSNHWFYSVYVEDGYPMDRDELIRRFDTEGIQTRPVWGLIHEQKPYRACRSYDVERAVDFRKHIVNVPCSTSLTEADVERVLRCLRM